SGIIGEQVDLNLKIAADVRPSQVLYELTSYLVLNKWRKPGEEPQVQLFGQLKRIAKEWLDNYLECKGGTYPAQLRYKVLAEEACEKIAHSIMRGAEGGTSVRALLDPYNPSGSTAHVNFTTSKMLRWQTDPTKSHVNWVILDSNWEGEFCRVVERHPRVLAYVKNHGHGFEVPYVHGGETHRYLPDFIVMVDDGRGPEDPLHLVVEVKGYRKEDAKEKKQTMEDYWAPGVNNLGVYGRWAFAEFRDVYMMGADLAAEIERDFNNLMESVAKPYAVLV
ncbi:MAG: restriction endonuclease, partial [Chloroflexota bacterium]|nr:restriction endonuclease [Chloroflexota bacterium]